MGSLLDELERQTNPAGVDGYDPKLATSLYLGLESNPDKEAAVRQKAARVGMPPEVVRGSDAAARMADVHNIIKDTDGSPKTRNLMSDPANAAITHDDTKNLTLIERTGGLLKDIGNFAIDFGRDIGEGIQDARDKTGDAFEQGQLTHTLGYEGHELLMTTGPEREVIEGRIDEIKTQMETLGVSDEGFLGFLVSAAEIVGQMHGTFSRPEAAGRVATGGIVGGSAGFAGGPLAPVTVSAGAVAGVISGTVSHMATDAFIVEGGHAYLEMIESGIDHDTARAVAMGVGVINSSLEILGTTAVAVPLTNAVKRLAKRAMGEALKKKTVTVAARNFVAGYGTAIAGETATEVMQEAVMIAGAEIARQFTDPEQDIKPISIDEAVARMEEVAIKTFKGMAVLALPGSGANYIADRSKARAAIEQDKLIETIVEAINESSISQRSPEVMANHVRDVIDVQAVDMPVEAFDEMMSDLGHGPEVLLTSEPLMIMYQEAKQIGGDVRIPAGPLVQNIIIGTDRVVFDKYRQHIRWKPGDMTAVEAAEFQSSGIEDELATNVKEAVEAVEVEQSDGPLVLTDAVAPSIEEAFDKYRQSIRQSKDDKVDGVAESQSSGIEDELAVNVQEAIKAVEVRQLGDDASVPTDAVAPSIKEAFDKYRQSIRQSKDDKVDGIAESQSSGIEEELAVNVQEAIKAVEVRQLDSPLLLTGPVETNLNPELKLAEDSLGLQALFRTADEAGMTPKQYETYLATVQRGANESNRRKEVLQTKREARQVAKEIKVEQQALIPEITESIGNEPIYSAMRGLGIQKLERRSIVDTYGKGAKDVIKELREAGVPVTNIREPGGIPIDMHADLYDLPSGDIMVNAMRDVMPEKQEVARLAEQEVRARNPELFSRQAEIQENLAALMHDNTQQVLAAEIDALTENRKAGRIKPALVREVARRALDQHAIRDISISKYLANARKHGRVAGKELRAGDREAARKAKVNQLLSLEFAREAEAKRQVVQKGHEYLSRFAKSTGKNLGPGYIDTIRAVISQFSLSPDLSSSKRVKLEDFVKKAQADGANFEFPQRLLDDGKRNYKDFTIHEFELVIQKIREINKAGIKVEQDRVEGRRTKTAIRVDAVVASLADIKVEQTLETRGRKQSASLSFEEAKLLMLNTDSVLRNLDKFKNLGPVYQAVKASIDLSVTDGYGSENNVGLVNREKKIAEDLLELYKVFSKEEMNTLSRTTITVPGFTAPLSRNAQLSLLLNVGNEQNRQALYDSEQVTEEQLDSLIQNASKRDMDFVQNVWNYLDSFWPEITDGTQRRRGFTPEKVKAGTIETDHGIYAGGYYPLRYDNNKGINDPSNESVEEAISEARYGRAMASHTRHDHTEQRLGSSGRPVLLDLFVINSHLDQVAYDLELGDAINETYSVVHSPDTKKAFRDAGQVATWKALDLWLGDVVTGEMHSGSVVEKGLRWLRAGFTVSKLGWNAGVAMIQPLGIIQTSVHLGHRNTLNGLKQMLKMPLYGKDNVFQFVNEQSQVMAQRDETFNKDIADASQLISDSWVRRVAPEGSVEFATNSYFYAIKKTQRFVDTWTWIAAKQAGLKEFNNDETLSTQFADRTVIRSQASGNFQERTAFERGSISSKTRQTELVRTFTALISYFMAKTNVTYERTKKTNFHNPGQVVSWASDMALLYVVEASLVGLIRGQWPDKDEEDNYGAAVAKYIAGEGLNTLFAGVPLIREFSSEAGGFRGGGVFSSVLGDFRKVVEQVGQGEIDKALINSANNLLGILLQYPAGQIGKTGRAIALSAEGEDVSILEFLMGPKWNKY